MSELSSAPAVEDALPKERPPKLTEEIDGLLAVLSEQPISLREVLEVLKGRAYILLLILLSMPFCVPAPPGLALVFGTIICLIGLRLSLRLTPWLPKRMLDMTISPKVLRPVLVATRKLATGFELVLRPRMVGLVDWAWAHHLNGAMISICGFLLALPLPVPFSNLLPAAVVVVLAAALLERDGRLVILGIAGFIFNCVFFASVAASVLVLGGKAIYWLRDLFSGVPLEVPIPPDLPPPLIDLPASTPVPVPVQ